MPGVLKLPITGAPLVEHPSQAPRWDVPRQQVELAAIARNGIKHFFTPDGDLFLEQLRLYFVSPLIGSARRFGFELDEDEVLNEIICRLISSKRGGACPAARASVLVDPFGYLWVCSIGWVRELHGHRAVSGELAETIAVPCEPDDGRYTPVNTVIERLVEIVADVVPDRVWCVVRDAVGWLVYNPPVRLSYEGEERAALSKQFPSLTSRQVKALSRVVWGTRPRQAETSFAGQLLLDEAWRPETASFVEVLLELAGAFRS